MRKKPLHKKLLRIGIAQQTATVAKLGFGIQIASGVLLFVAFFGALFQAAGVINVQPDGLGVEELEASYAAAATGCSDGTAHGQCVVQRTGDSADRPWYCENGILIEDSATCGCPSGYYAWSDGSCTLRPHLRTFTHDLRYDDAGLVDTTFKALHFDEVFSHIAFKATYKALNPQVKLGNYRNYSALTDTEIADAVPAWCAEQTPACNTQDLIIHFRDDVGTRCDYFGNCQYAKGWNASCSPNCTPAATATSREESRAPNSWLLRWSDVNFSNQHWVAFNNQAITTGMESGGAEADIILSDNGDFYPGGSAFDKSVEYYGIPLDGNHPRIQEAFDAQRNMATYVSDYFGKEKQVVPNARALYWYFHPYFYAGYQSLNNPIEIEAWLTWNDLNQPSGGVPRALTYNVDYRDTKMMLSDSLAGQKFYLQGINESTTNTPQAQMFLLANFYLVNNKNLSFAYRDFTEWNKDGNFWPTGPVEDYLWIPAFDYDIGTPIANTFGKQDVFGNSGTIEHFELATDVDPSTPSPITSGTTRNYHLFARQYSNALVLVKYREYGGYLGNSSRTTHDLGGEYRRLGADGILDSTILTSIALANNEAAVLIPVVPGVPTVCVEDWSCGTWNTCGVDGVQTRTCTDANSCGTIASRPMLSQTCTPPQTSCVPRWQCGEWSACSNNEQTRTCTDANDCGQNPPPNIIGRQCASDPPPTREDLPPDVGGNDDLNPPDTSILHVDDTLFTDHVLVSWSGSDDVTTSPHLRFSVKLDDRPWSPYQKRTSRLFTELSNGVHTITVRAVDEAGNDDPVPAEATFTVKRVLRVVTGAGSGGGPHVRVFDYLGNVTNQFFAYHPGFRGGVNVAAGDIDGNGYDEIITGAGRGGGPQVRIFDDEGNVQGQFFAFPEGFRGGIHVASGDVDDDGKDEIIVAPATGGGPMVRIFDGRGKLEAQFWAYDEKFRGGVNLATADFNNDGRDEVVVAPADKGGPHVRVFTLSKKGAHVSAQFFAYPSTRRGGVSLATGDILDDGIPEIITSPTEGGYPADIRIFRATGSLERYFFAADERFHGGANVAAGDLYGFDNTAEILTSTYRNGSPGVFVFVKKNETTLQRILSYYAYAPSFRGGVNITMGHFAP